MSAQAPMRRLLALRLLEEEREETELHKQRQARDICFEALQASERKERVASRALHTALDDGDRPAAISAEMVLACVPLERSILQRKLAQLNEAVAVAREVWHASRVRRMQMETLMQGVDAARRREQLLREQKALDGWFLTSLSSFGTSLGSEKDESFQREWAGVPAKNGTAHAYGQSE